MQDTQRFISFTSFLKFLGISFLFALLFSGTACTTLNKLPHKEKKTLQEKMENSPVFSKSFTGFALLDPKKKELLYQYNADKYFTPASNTKIFTLYTSLKVLGDKLPILKYITVGDSLIFWGTGNPLFLHPDFSEDKTVFDFLSNREEQLFFAPYNFQDERFGPGWAWDDYLYYYQPEKASFPIYGNTVQVKKEVQNGEVLIEPKYFQSRTSLNTKLGGNSPSIRRGEFSNHFEYNPQAVSAKSFSFDIPFDYSPEFVCSLLSDTLKRQVKLFELGILPPENCETIEMHIPDTLFRRLMQNSDNFIAEQMMLLCSDKLFGVQNTERAIEFSLDSLLFDLPDEAIWKDGSGLSRYNLFTPRTIVFLLQKLYREIPSERLFDIFPAGGQSGTIQKRYGGNPPYVFAKTGTLSNKHCLSGYLLTKSGKTFIFSFMHNNFITSSGPLKGEMEKVLRYLHENL